MPEDSKSAIRNCTRAVVAAIDEYEEGKDSAKLRQKLLGAVRPLAMHPDLLTLGARRQANHIENSKWIYYDGTISITLDEFPKGKRIPPHDHGIWEAIVLCRGSLGHTVYERIDDGKVEGHAELRTVEDVTLAPGEIAMVVPPSEIHSFMAESDGTFVLTVVGGEYKPQRHYYNPEEKTYVVRTPRALASEAAVKAAH